MTIPPLNDGGPSGVNSAGVAGITQIFEQLSKLKQQQFTGQLTITSEDRSNYTLSLYLGRLLYGSGGKHTVRRWLRQVSKAAPSLDANATQQYLAQEGSTLGNAWEYEALCRLVDHRLLSPEQVIRIIQGILQEIFFDVAQMWLMECREQPESPPRRQLGLLDPIQFLEQQSNHWQRWQTTKFRSYSLDAAPVIQQSEQLQHSTSAGVFQTLSQLLDGQRTLWDLSLQMNRSPIDVVGSLFPYVEAGMIDLRQIPDLAPPLPVAVAPPDAEAPLIACVDDSPWVCQTLEKVVQMAGYRFLGIQEPLRAIPTLLSQKPALVLLDLRMPNTNGYEICSQLRKISAFQTTPIVILTGNDGIVDRMRAKVVGATDFLSKSIEQEQLLTVLQRYVTVNAR